MNDNTLCPCTYWARTTGQMNAEGLHHPKCDGTGQHIESITHRPADDVPADRVCATTAFARECPGYQSSIDAYLDSDVLSAPDHVLKALNYRLAFCHGHDAATAHLSQQLQEANEKIAVLRKGLEHYADEGNWDDGDTPGDHQRIYNCLYIDGPDERAGFDIAQAALKDADKGE